MLYSFLIRYSCVYVTILPICRVVTFFSQQNIKVARKMTSTIAKVVKKTSCSVFILWLIHYHLYLYPNIHQLLYLQTYTDYFSIPKNNVITYVAAIYSSNQFQNTCNFRNNVITLQRDCGLITPATGLKPWVHILTKAIMHSVTSSHTSMLTRHR